MSAKENKEFLRQGFKEWNETARDEARIRSLYGKHWAPGYIYHLSSLPDMNREQTIQRMVTVVSAFPDLNFSIDDMVAEGDKVAVKYTIKGTHKGTYQGIPATGKQIAVKGVEIFKIAGRKLVEGWDFPDSLGLMTQLGIVPSAAPKT
jgi:steroid delta-isomerase-like uncharacterized protein